MGEGCGMTEFLVAEFAINILNRCHFDRQDAG